MIEITIDNRLRINEKLDSDLQSIVQLAFTYSNPKYAKMIAMGLPRWQISEPTTYKTWTLENGLLTLPRGGLKRLCDLFISEGMKFTIKDTRHAGKKLKKGVTGKIARPLYPYQQTAIDILLQKQNCLLRAGTGCLAGDTIIRVNRGGCTRKYQLKDLVHCFNGGHLVSGKPWDLSIPTMVQSHYSDNTIRLNKLKGAYESGVKSVYSVTLENGRTMKASATHPFYTNEGWKQTNELTQEMSVCVLNRKDKIQNTTKKKSWYRVCKGLNHHPFVGRKNHGCSVPAHRLIAEATMNGMDLETFVRRVRMNQLSGLQFLDPTKYAVHHIDANSHNNDPSNLQILTHYEHNLLHSKKDRIINRVLASTHYVKIKCIEYAGDEMTYDLEMESEPRNFLANDMVVHNSGKTTMALAMISALNVPSIVIVWSANLFDQWVKRCTSELGIPHEEIGMISGKKRILKPVTIAMQQTLNSRGIDKELKEYFGAVFVDEVQRASAPTLYKVIDPFPALYRVGISADETRKDEKEFLIYDLFSKEGTDIPKETLIKSGHVLDVEILIVPTDFKAPWYDPRDWENGFNRLLEEMETNDDRNDLVASIVAQEVAKNEQVMVLAHRRDHCRVLDAAISSYGIESGFLIGGPDYKAVFQETLANIHAGKIKVGVGTVQAVGQALDIPTLGVAVASTPLATNRQQFGQVRGRVCRTAEGKTEAKLYYLWDRFVYGTSHVKNLMRWNAVVKIWHQDRWIPASEFLRITK